MLLLSLFIYLLYHTGGLSKRIPVLFYEEQSHPQLYDWKATIYPGNMHPQSVIIQICAPVQSSVALYELLAHIETRRSRKTYVLGTFVLLCNPWLKGESMQLLPLAVLVHSLLLSFCRHNSNYHRFSGDPVYMPLDAHKEEYIKSDYGLVYMGSSLNVSKRPWSFGLVCDPESQNKSAQIIYSSIISR